MVKHLHMFVKSLHLTTWILMHSHDHPFYKGKSVYLTIYVDAVIITCVILKCMILRERYAKKDMADMGECAFDTHQEVHLTGSIGVH